MEYRENKVMTFGVAVTLLLALTSFAQDKARSSTTQEMSEMQMSCTDHPGGKQVRMEGMHHAQMQNSHEQPKTFIDAITQHTASGTTVEPNSTPASMLMANERKLDADVPWGGISKRIATERPSRLR